MDYFNKLSDSVNDVVGNVDGNNILKTIVIIVFALYAALAAPKLPEYLLDLFENQWFKLAYMCMIGYLATKDITASVMAAVALLITLQVLSSNRLKKAVSTLLEKEKFGQVTGVDTPFDLYKEYQSRSNMVLSESEQQINKSMSELAGPLSSPSGDPNSPHGTYIPILNVDDNVPKQEIKDNEGKCNVDMGFSGFDGPLYAPV